MVRVQSERFVQQLPRPPSLTESLPGARGIEPCLGVGRMEAEGCVEGGDSLLRPTEVQEETSLVAVGEVPALRRGADRGVIVCQRLAGPTQRSLDVRAEEERPCVRRLDSLEDGQTILILADRMEDPGELAPCLGCRVDVQCFPE